MHVAILVVTWMINSLKCVSAPSDFSMEFRISTKWNGENIDHDPVAMKLSKQNEDFVFLEVEAPYFDDPKPTGPPGQPFPQLWDYEVVEAFFLGIGDKYLEVELSPHGHHLVLMLNGRRNIIKDQLSLEYSSQINNDTKNWTGTAKIPLSYFPPSVSKFNAYAIHGNNKSRVYEALYPTESGQHSEPDFHRLEYFKQIDLSNLLPTNDAESDAWKEALATEHQ